MPTLLPRLLKPIKNHSLFLFGARNTGKSTLIHQQFASKECYWVNLLDTLIEARYARNPMELFAEVLALPDSVNYVVVDEIQKIPKLLDIVHLLMEKTKKIFILTGSSARKLRQSGVNLLAGRAFVFQLFPFSFIELGNQFELQKALQFGLLPTVWNVDTDEERRFFLEAYTQTYLKEEVWAEHLINRLDPFRRFLEVAAQCNGKIINMSQIAKDTGVDEKTIKNYYTILEDTLIGEMLLPFQHSFRKRLRAKPKFFFFDLGVTRALLFSLSYPIQPRTSAYGEAFEHFIILECLKLTRYYHLEYRFSFLATKDDVEIDLVVERPGQPILLIEIKSRNDVQLDHLTALLSIQKDLPNSIAVCFSQNSQARKYDEVTIMPWQEGLKFFFTV